MKTSRYNNSIQKFWTISELITNHVFEYGYDKATNPIDRVYEWAVRLDKYHNEVKAMQRYHIECVSEKPSDYTIPYTNDTLLDLYYNLNYISDRFKSLNRIQLLIDTPKIYGELIGTIIGCGYGE